jgi:primosomal protein N' (replication factor Y)
MVKPSRPAYVEVTVPLAVDRLFTYAVPPAVEPALHPGMRVLVPFGRTHMVGVVVRPVETPPEGVICRPIGRVLDTTPLFSPALLQLAEWVADYYFAPLGSVHRTMLPPGLLVRKANPTKSAADFWPVRRIKGVVKVHPLPEAPLTEHQRKALDLLSCTPLPVTLADASKRWGLSRAVLEALAAKGHLTVDWVEVVRTPWLSTTVSPSAGFELSDAQAVAVQVVEDRLRQGGFHSCLLHGVTGSGKTEIYLRLIRKLVEEGRGALVLVPEIGLTPQVAGQFRAWFGDRLAIQHSGLSDGERFDQWRRIRNGDVQVVVGTRSGVFAPVRRLALIVIDEEQDQSYKQEETPRYHARDTALVRGRLEDAVVLLGSATPQVETFYAATERGLHQYLALPERIRNRPLPEVHVADMRKEFERRGRRGQILSNLLEEKIGECLARREQALILLNRRGYARMLLCRSCGYAESCRDCSITLTYHRSIGRLLCHFCGYSCPVPSRCPECGKEYLYQVGLGTEKLQEFLAERFPDCVVGRLDRDVASRRGRLEQVLADFAAGRIQLLVGTQMIAKGHDFPQVTLVGVLQAELGLKVADFRAAERTFQLLTQVAGRSGRGEQPGEVVIQTYYPDHYSLQFACRQEYLPFFQREVEFRKRFQYPPFTYLAGILVEHRDESATERKALELAEILVACRDRLSKKNRLRVLGPARAYIERLKGYYRWHILLKGVERRELHQVVGAALAEAGQRKMSLRRVTVDVDPMEVP